MATSLKFPPGTLLQIPRRKIARWGSEGKFLVHVALGVSCISGGGKSNRTRSLYPASAPPHSCTCSGAKRIGERELDELEGDRP
jgi:hypothetical protein